MASIICNECGWEMSEFEYDFEDVRAMGCSECDSRDLTEGE